MKERKAVVAGQFYPQSPEQLNEQLHSFCDVAPNENIQPHGLIVPHAGYYYSGAVAGMAYRYLKSLSRQIKRVILLGPSHRVALRGSAVCSYDFFSTPLGKIPVARDDYLQLLEAGLVSSCDQAHLQEHSLEVQLPFLQYCLESFQIVPIVVGLCQPNNIKEILNLLQVNDSSTLVVVSSDLSHYHTYQQAQVLDNNSVRKILNYENNLHPEDACGCYAVNGFLSYAQSQNWQAQLISQANSGDISGTQKEVVGYASFIFC